jgi:hypothetical protein
MSITDLPLVLFRQTPATFRDAHLLPLPSGEGPLLAATAGKQRRPK